MSKLYRFGVSFILISGILAFGTISLSFIIPSSNQLSLSSNKINDNKTKYTIPSNKNNKKIISNNKTNDIDFSWIVIEPWIGL
jgi:hypothetical protein